MQIVNRTIPNALSIMNDIDRLYAQLSEFETVKPIVPQRYDWSFESLVTTFEEFSGRKWSIEYEDREYEKIEPIENNNIILAFSGGKDSIASAMRFKQFGYNVYLYHMRNINPTFSDEWECAQKLADMLELPIFIDEVHFKMFHKWTEHPMKNMLIANGALSYGIREGITTHIAFGNYTTSYLVDNVFDRCAGDCMDMWENYDEIIQRSIPTFEMDANLDNMGDTLNMLADRPDLLNESLSCLCRHSLRDYRKNWVKQKYGIDLFARRCGSCYKCCVEYIYMADHDKLPFSEGYYKYCLGQLYRVALVEKIPVKDVLDIWDYYIFYPLENSKIASQLPTARLLKEKIKWQ